MAWIEVHQSLISHRKTLALADALGMKPIQAVGHLVALWTWAVDNASRNGDITIMSPKSIVTVMQWDGDAQLFFDNLVRVGFLDVVENRLFIHNWERYIGRLLDRRESNADRQRRFRERQSAMKPINPTVTGDVTVTSPLSNAPPYPTVPNRTVPISSAANATAPSPRTSRKPPENPSDVTLVMQGLEKARGYPSGHYPKEAAAAKKMLAQGYTAEEILACAAKYQTEPFWADKVCELTYIQGQIGAWKKARAAPAVNGHANGNGHAPMPPRNPDEGAPPSIFAHRKANVR